MTEKASPFRRTSVPKNFLRAGWKAQPSTLRETKKKGADPAGRAKKL
jgi:hypothetical protein